MVPLSLQLFGGFLLGGLFRPLSLQFKFLRISTTFAQLTGKFFLRFLCIKICVFGQQESFIFENSCLTNCCAEPKGPKYYNESNHIYLLQQIKRLGGSALLKDLWVKEMFALLLQSREFGIILEGATHVNKHWPPFRPLFLSKTWETIHVMFTIVWIQYRCFCPYFFPKREKRSLSTIHSTIRFYTILPSAVKKTFLPKE